MQDTHPIRSYRESRKPAPMTQEQFAAALGVSKAAVSRWEQGKRTPRSQELVRKIAEMTGVSVSELLGYGAAE